MQNIKDLAASSAKTWGEIAQAIDDNFKGTTDEQKNELKWLRAIDANGNPMLISAEDHAKVVGGLIKHVNFSAIRIADCNEAIPKQYSTKETYIIDYATKNGPYEGASGFLEAYRWDVGKFCTQVLYSGEKCELCMRISDEEGNFSEWETIYSK